MTTPPPLFPGLDARLRGVARSAALGSAGALLVALGAGFLVAAFWVGLAAALGALVASVLLGLVFAGLGLTMLGLAARRPPPPPPPPPDSDDDATLRRLLREAGLSVPPKGEAPALSEAFLFGLILAMRLRRGGGPR